MDKGLLCFIRSLMVLFYFFPLWSLLLHSVWERAKLPQSCLTVCDAVDHSPPVSLHGILQARILAWIAIPSSRQSSRPRDPASNMSPALASRFFTTTAIWEACILQYQFSSVQFSCSVVSDSLQPHESQHARPPCPSPTPRVYPNSCPSSQWCNPATLQEN